MTLRSPLLALLTLSCASLTRIEATPPMVNPAGRCLTVENGPGTQIGTVTYIPAAAP